MNMIHFMSPTLPIVVLNRFPGDGAPYYSGFTAIDLCDGDFEHLAISVGKFAYEPDTVAEYVAAASAMNAGTVHAETHLRISDSIEKAASLSEAFQRATNGVGGALFFVYQDHQWHHGLLSHESADEFALDPLTGAYSVPASRFLTDRLDDLVLSEQDTQGPQSILDRAVQCAIGQKVDWLVNYENHPALRELCEWWNSTVESKRACADVFLLYIWDEPKKMFVPGDYEEPPMSAKDMRSWGSGEVAYFRYGATTVAVIFGKGEQHYFVNDDGCVTALTATGNFMSGAWCDPYKFNVSRVSMQSLQRLPELASKISIPHPKRHQEISL